MARITSTIGSLSGKLGNVRIWKSGNNTIAAIIPHEARNPRTEAQMRQRVKINNILNIYKILKPALRENYEGIDGNRNAATFFRKYNLMQKPVWLTCMEKDRNRCVLAPYIVSHGIITPIQYSATKTALTSNIGIGDLEVSPETQIDTLTGMIRQHNEDWSDGDTLQITVLRQSLLNDKDEGLAPIDMATATLSMTQYSDRQLASFPDFQTLTGLGIRLCNDNGMLSIALPDSDKYVYAIALVHGRGKGMKRIVSAQSLALSDSTLYEQHSSDEKMYEALKTYKTNFDKHSHIQK